MKTKIIMMSALLALVATGCTKDDNQKVNDGRIKIFAEGMTAAGGNTKLLVDPANLTGKNGIQWKAGETVNVNGTPKSISGDKTDGYSIDASSVSLASDGALYAIYPGNSFASIASYGNSWTVTNNQNAASSISLTSLAIRFYNDGTHDIVFPMAGKAVVNDEQMTFKHLTAGFKMTLNNTKSESVTLKKIKVYVYGSNSTEGTTTINGVAYTVRWSNQGMMPVVPVGPIGSITDQDLSYGSEMVFNLYNESATTTGKDIAASESLTFCIPVTLASVRRITVIGYSDDNCTTPVFSKTSAVTAELQPNYMYTVRDINIE